MTSTENRPTEVASLRRLLLVLVPAMLLIPIASDMVSLVLPLITEEFASSTAQVAWVVTGFLLACAIGIPIFGRMADRVGLRVLLASALATFATGSAICAMAPGLIVLVLGRIVTGTGGAAIPVLAIVAAARLLPAHQSAIAVGFIAAAGGVGTALGPAVGGILGQVLGWRALFWLLTAAAAVLVLAVRRVIPNTEPTDTRRLDLLGALLLGASVGLVLFGITRTEGAAGLATTSSWVALLAGALTTCLFAWRTATCAHPFLPPSLFAHPGYLSGVTVIFLAMAVNLSALVLVPLLVIDVNELTPGQGSIVMIPGGLALAALSPLGAKITAKGVNEGTLALVGLSTIAASMLFLSATAGQSPVPSALAVLALGAGFALVVTPVTHAVTQTLPPDQVGAGMGIFQGAQFLGAGAGPALFGTLLTARQAGQSSPINPLHSGSANAYSDTFLALAVIAVAAALGALRLRTALTNPRA